MSESVASVRETSSSKNNASGNVRSNNGGLYYTTSTTETSTYYDATTTDTYTIDNVGVASQTLYPNSVWIGRINLDGSIHQSTDAGAYNVGGGGGGKAKIEGGTKTQDQTKMGDNANTSQNAFFGGANFNYWYGVNSITVQGTTYTGFCTVSASGWFYKYDSVQKTNTYQVTTSNSTSFT